MHSVNFGHMTLETGPQRKQEGGVPPMEAVRADRMAHMADPHHANLMSLQDDYRGKIDPDEVVNTYQNTLRASVDKDPAIIKRQAATVLDAMVGGNERSPN